MQAAAQAKDMGTIVIRALAGGEIGALAAAGGIAPARGAEATMAA